MKPILYQANETNYNHRGLGSLNDVLEYKVTEVLNGEFELFLEYPVAGKMYDEIKDNRLIKAKPNRKDDPHVFRIYEVEKILETQTVLIYARSNVYDLAGNLVPSLILRDHTPNNAWNRIKEAALEPIDFNFHSDITSRASKLEWENQNPLSCVVGEEGSMLQTWGGELKFGNKWLWLYRRRGNDNVTTIRYGKNIEGLKVTYSTKGLTTAILPYATIRDEVNDKDIKITGNIVESQYVNNYPYTYYQAVEYTEEDGVTNLSSLNNAAKSYFTENKDIDLPIINMEINLIDLSHSKEYAKFKDLEVIELGDTITVYVKKFNVNITAKVNKVVYNGLTEENEELEVGATRATLYDEYRDLTNKEFHKNIKPYEDNLNIIQIAANGKNRIFRGPKEPTDNLQEGDLWYKPIGDGEMELYIYDGSSWGDPVVTTGINKQIQAELDQAEDDIKTVKEGAEQAQEDANAILEGLGVSDLSSGHATIVGEIKHNVENRINILDGYYTDVKTLADGHQTTLAKLGTEPGDVILDYHRLTERTNLYERVLGSDEEGIGGSVARIVASSDIIQQEVRTTAEQVVSGKLSENLAAGVGQNELHSLPPDIVARFILDEDLIPGKAYYIKVETDGDGSDLRLHRMGQDDKPFTTTVNNNMYEIRFTFQTYGNPLNEIRVTNNGESAIGFALREVYMIDPDSLSSIAGENSAVTRTLQTQLANSWSVQNLNSAGDIVGQINLTDGNALIEGRSIVLDSDTTVRGTFRVTNTMVASGISATKITTGTLNAANVNVININANNIVANATNFVVSAWNGYAGGNVSITGDGIISTASNGSQTYIQNGIVGTRNPGGASLGYIGYKKDVSGSPMFNIQTSWGSHFTVSGNLGGEREKKMMQITSGSDETLFYTQHVRLLGERLDIGWDHYLSGTTNRLLITGKESVSLRANESTVFAVSNNGRKNFASMHANLSMEGNTIINQSDLRLKDNIEDVDFSGIEETEKIMIKSYNYKEDHPRTEQFPKGKQFGPIAQYSDFLAGATGGHNDDHYLSIDLNKQINLNTLTNQELIKRVKELERKVEEIT